MWRSSFTCVKHFDNKNMFGCYLGHNSSIIFVEVVIIKFAEKTREKKNCLCQSEAKCRNFECQVILHVRIRNIIFKSHKYYKTLRKHVCGAVEALALGSSYRIWSFRTNTPAFRQRTSTEEHNELKERINWLGTFFHLLYFPFLTFPRFCHSPLLQSKEGGQSN